MAVGIRRRVEVLEQGSGGECPHCSGVIGVFVGGNLHRASRKGCETMTPEQWAEAFEDGRCPLCGAEPVRIKVVYDGEAE